MLARAAEIIEAADRCGVRIVETACVDGLYVYVRSRKSHVELNNEEMARKLTLPLAG